MATCPRWSLAVCAEVGTARAGGLTSSRNDVSQSQRREGTADGDSGTGTSLFTFPAAINCLLVLAQRRGASHTSSVLGGGALPFPLPADDGVEKMARGSTGIPSTFLQRGAGPAILQSPSSPSGGHPFLSQPRAALDGGDLHGGIPKGTLMGHLWCCTKLCVVGSHHRFPTWV